MARLIRGRPRGRFKRRCSPMNFARASRPSRSIGSSLAIVEQRQAVWPNCNVNLIALSISAKDGTTRSRSIAFGGSSVVGGNVVPELMNVFDDVVGFLD